MNTISVNELKEKLKRHEKWLKDGDGERLVLIGYDLRYSDLLHSDLSHSDLRYSDLRYSDLRYSDLRYSDLRYSDLRYSNMSYSDMSYSNLDFSAFPLWCGSSKFKCSENLVRKLFAHICTLEVLDASDEMKTALTAIRNEAEKSHRAIDLEITKE